MISNWPSNSTTTSVTTGIISTYWWPLRCVGRKPWSQTNCTCCSNSARMAAWNLLPYRRSRAKSVKMPGKRPCRVEQFRRIAAAGQRPALRQVQMNAQIEGALGIAQRSPLCHRGKALGAHSPWPTFSTLAVPARHRGRWPAATCWSAGPVESRVECRRLRPGSFPGRRRGARGAGGPRACSFSGGLARCVFAATFRAAGKPAG